MFERSYLLSLWHEPSLGSTCKQSSNSSPTWGVWGITFPLGTAQWVSQCQAQQTPLYFHSSSCTFLWRVPWCQPMCHPSHMGGNYPFSLLSVHLRIILNSIIFSLRDNMKSPFTLSPQGAERKCFISKSQPQNFQGDRGVYAIFFLFPHLNILRKAIGHIDIKVFFFGNILLLTGSTTVHMT